MTLKIEDKIELAKYRIEKAKRILDDARKLFELNSYDSAVNRAYYAILTASRALLILRGVDPETHDGVKTMLSKEYIKTSILPTEFSEIFRSLSAKGTDSDYGDFIEITFEEAKDSLEKAKKFVDVASETLEKIIKEMGF